MDVLLYLLMLPPSSTNRASSFSLGINESPELELCESPKDVSGTLAPYLDVDDTSVDGTPAIIKLIRYGTSSNSDSQLNRVEHDERSSAGQNGRSSARRTDEEHGWRRDSKEHRNNRTEVKAAASNVNDEKAKDSKDENHVWRHGGYFRMEANPKPPTRKRPAFREQKAPADPGKTDKAASNTATPNIQDHAVESEKRDERRFNSKLTDRPERPSARNRELAKGEAARSDSRDRYGGVSSRYRGRERFNPRQGYYRTDGGRVEKWKHDLYDDAKKSPNPKNEEDQISKIEALLASQVLGCFWWQLWISYFYFRLIIDKMTVRNPCT